MGWLVAALLLVLLQSTDFNADGVKALEANDYEAAAQQFTKAVEADPDDYSAHFHLALAYSLLGRDGEAIPIYRKVLELKPGLYQAEVNLGMLLLRQKQPSEAVPHLQAAAEQKPKEFRPAFYLAEALYEEGNFEKAEEYYKIAADLNPKSAGAQLGLGRSRARQERLAEAAGHFRKAAELDSDFKDALLELASLHEKQGEPAQAMAIYAQFPENVGARERLGELLLQAQRPSEAIPHLEWAVEKSPTSANRVALATAYLRSKQQAKAVPLLELAVAAEPENNKLRMMHGRTLRDQRKFAPAAAEFLRVAQAQPDSAEAWSELAGMLILLESYPQALAALDRLRALGSEEPAHHFFRAIILDKAGQHEPALESYEKFLAMSRGESPNEEFKARQRVRIIKKELNRR
jgi:tetratricopeptide (TPR) repeat protein